MTLTVQIEQHGGPAVLQLVETEVGEPGPGQLRLRQTAIGLNFIDTYHRSGLYPVKLPSGLGTEAAGVVEAVGGGGVADFKPGDRVAYGGTGLGAYAQTRLIDAARVIRLPTHVDDESAAALMLKGMTAYYLLFQTFQVRAGQTVLAHAAAGGVGSVLVPWAKHLGATVIGTAGGADKCALAKRYGCDHVIDYRAQDFVAETRRLTDGAGVHVVYDSVGKDTLPGSLDCLRRRGMLVSFGNASGKPAPVDPLTLSAKGSLFLTRPTLADYTATREELLAAAGALFEALRAGVFKADVRQRYALRDVAQAHADLEARRTSGTTLLMP